MVLGILFIGLCVSFLRLSRFGVDPFSAMNLGISGFIGWSFGTWQLLVNAIILVVVFFQVKSCIGAGTIINMVFVGYIADFICYVANDVVQIQMNLPLRIIALLLVHEDCVNIIMKDLIKLMDPKYIEVTGIFTPRGGISIWPYANYGKPGTKYEKLAEQRFATHE